MTDQTKTDWLFTFNMEDMSDQKTWSDIRLIHESECGWYVVYSGLYRGRRVAIKGLKQEFRSSEFHRSLLYKEFAVISGLSHQNIVTGLWIAEVPDIGEAILMEFIDGITLGDYLETNPSIEAVQIVDILRQLCSAVSYMHSRQTIHCDLKPSNIMITNSGFVKVIDFGMSRGNGFERLDFSGGTKGFTAPENFDSETKATAAVDIYSIGKILKQLDGKGIFKGVWKRCLSSDPERRPSSINWISERLNAIYISRIKRKILYGAIGVFIGIAVVSISFFLIWRSDSYSEGEDKVSENLHAVDLIPDDGELPDSTPSPAVMAAPTAMQIFNGPEATEEHPDENVDEANADNRSFEERYAEKLNQVVEMRFRQHLELIDTMTTGRSNELQSIRHWRWLAKKDMRRWLEENLAPYYSMVEETMVDVERYIEEYTESSNTLGMESSHRVAAIKRCPALAGCQMGYNYYVGIDEGVVGKLGEDGVWHEERIKVHNDRTDPVATREALNEKMKEAMKD